MTAVLDTLVAVRRTAMDLLARREHGRVELTRKLRQRGALPEMIDTALDRLTEEGLLSESRYLESFVSYRARSGYGPLRIREELGQRPATYRYRACLARKRYQLARTTGRHLAAQVCRALTDRHARACQARALPGLSGFFHGDDQPLVQRSRNGRLNKNGPLFR